MANDWIDLRLPSRRQLGRFILWSCGRIVFSGFVFCLDATSQILIVGNTLIKWTRKATLNLMRVYDQLPYAGTPRNTIIDATAIAIIEPTEIVTDLVRSLEGKHCLVIGDTGTGKSTIAQWLAYQVGGTVTVYDPDAAPDEWLGLNVIGRCGNFAAIQKAMADDLDDLEARIKVRGEDGDKALIGREGVLIAEEFPLLADEVDNAVEWLLRHARRGRKPRKFLIALSQDDSVKALQIEGEGSVRKNFRMVRLGKFAVTHAKALKDVAALEWIKSGSYRCMVDDIPCQLPDLSQFKAVTQQLQLSVGSLQSPTPEIGAETAFQQQSLTVTLNSKIGIDGRIVLERAVRGCLEAGMSESKIIKEVLGYQGSQYQMGKNVLESMKKEGKRS